MHKKSLLRKLIMISISMVLFLNISGCNILGSSNKSDQEQTENTSEGNVTDSANDLMANLKSENPEPDQDLEKAEFMQQFSVELLKTLAADSDDNILFSPLSIYYALGMTQNAASEDTVRQISEILHSEPDTLNRYLYSYRTLLDQEQDENVKLNLANSLWLNQAMQDQIQVQQKFLQTNADYYGAELREIKFDDQGKDLINSWVDQNTKGMIPEIIDQIPQDAFMYLVNALAFEGKWQHKYEEEDIEEAFFYPADNEHPEEIQMMYSTENKYFENEQAKGFLKNYKNPRYAFMAILPDHDLSLEEYIAGLDSDSLGELFDSVREEEVETGIPEFTTEFATELSDALKSLGMNDAFDPAASNFTDGFKSQNPVIINRILHKTYIEVDAEGTKAAAATAVEFATTMAPIDEVNKVILDRPFIYLIIDQELEVPIFVGKMLSIKSEE